VRYFERAAAAATRTGKGRYTKPRPLLGAGVSLVMAGDGDRSACRTGRELTNPLWSSGLPTAVAPRAPAWAGFPATSKRTAAAAAEESPRDDAASVSPRTEAR
jgi:hypothetical protein